MNKIIKTMLLFLFAFLINKVVKAQSDTIKIIAKNKEKTVILENNEEANILFEDTVSSITISLEKKQKIFKIPSIDSTAGNNFKLNIKERGFEKKNYKFNILCDIALGFARSPSMQGDIYFITTPPPTTPKLNNGYNLSINIVKQEINLYKERLSLITAFGLNQYVYQTEDRRIQTFKDRITNRYDFGIDSFNRFSRNNILSNFLQVPILLKIASKNKKKHNFAAAAGVELNFNNQVFSRQKIKTKDEKINSRINIGYHINNILPSYIVKIQYGNLSLFARYTSGRIMNGYLNNQNVFSFGVASKF